MEKINVEWSEAIQISKDQAELNNMKEAEDIETREQMQEDFNEMIGQEGVTFESIEDMVHGYGYDSDEIENLIETFC